MAPPPVTIYITSLTSHPTVRAHTELLHRALKGNKIPYEAFDLVMDEAAKTRWQRAKPAGKAIGLPGYLVAGEWIGTMDDFEEAVECGTLSTFLKQNLDIAPEDAAGNTSDTITQAELDDLMKGMSEGDLETLAGHLDTEQPAKPKSIETIPTPRTVPQPAVKPPITVDTQETMSKAGLPSPTSVPLGSPISPSPDSSRSKSRDRKSKEDLAREMAEAGTIEGLLAAMEEADGRGSGAI